MVCGDSNSPCCGGFRGGCVWRRWGHFWLDGRSDASPERGDDEFARDSEFGWAEVCEGDGDTGPGDEGGCVVPGGEEGL